MLKFLISFSQIAVRLCSGTFKGLVNQGCIFKGLDSLLELSQFIVNCSEIVPRIIRIWILIYKFFIIRNTVLELICDIQAISQLIQGVFMVYVQLYCCFVILYSLNEFWYASPIW